MPSGDDLSTALIDSIGKSTAIDAASDLLEVALDAALEEGVAKDLPIIGSLVAIARTGVAIRERILVKKILSFLVGLADVGEDARQEFSRQMDDDPDRRQAVGETLLVLLDRLDDAEKARKLAKGFAALLRGQTSEGGFHRLSRAIDRVALSQDIDHLGGWREAVQRLPEDVGLSLNSAGFVELNSAPSTRYTDGSMDYRKTNLGELAERVLLG